MCLARQDNSLERLLHGLRSIVGYPDDALPLSFCSPHCGALRLIMPGQKLHRSVVDDLKEERTRIGRLVAGKKSHQVYK